MDLYDWFRKADKIVNAYHLDVLRDEGYATRAIVAIVDGYDGGDLTIDDIRAQLADTAPVEVWQTGFRVELTVDGEDQDVRHWLDAFETTAVTADALADVIAEYIGDRFDGAEMVVAVWDPDFPRSQTTIRLSSKEAP